MDWIRQEERWKWIELDRKRRTYLRPIRFPNETFQVIVFQRQTRKGSIHWTCKISSCKISSCEISSCKISSCNGWSGWIGECSPPSRLVWVEAGSIERVFDPETSEAGTNAFPETGSHGFTRIKMMRFWQLVSSDQTLLHSIRFDSLPFPFPSNNKLWFNVISTWSKIGTKCHKIVSNEENKLFSNMDSWDLKYLRMEWK